MAIKLFKGQVKISDVQAALDEVMERVNNIITTYNNSSYVKDIDYTVGGSTLGSSGYTLTVGGMKQFMKACDGYVSGAKPFKVSGTELKMTTGMLVAKNGIFRLPDTVINIPTDSKRRTIYFNTNTKQYQWTGDGTTSTIVTEKKLVGSKLYYGLSNDPRAMILRKEVYDHNEVGRKTIFPNSEIVIDGQKRECIAFYKYISGENTTESVKDGKFKIPIEMYAHVTGNLTKDDALILNLKNRGSGNRNGVTLGTYDVDAGIFEPKLDITFYTTNWYYVVVEIQGCQKFGITDKGAPYYMLSSIGSCTSGKEKDETFDTVHIRFKRNTYNALVAEVQYVQRSTGTIAYTKEIQMPAGIDSYNINTLLPRTWYMDHATNFEDGDPVRVRNDLKAVWYEEDCMIKLSNGSSVGLSADTQAYSHNKVVEIESNDAAYRICDINPNAETKLISNIKGVQNEKINGTFKITSESRWVKPVCVSDNGTFRGETPDTSKQSLFIWGQEAIGHEDSKRRTNNLFLFGKKVQWNTYAGHRKLDWWSPLNLLFVPKGVANPYTYDTISSNFTHWFKVNISKNIKDT